MFNAEHAIAALPACLHGPDLMSFLYLVKTSMDYGFLRSAGVCFIDERGYANNISRFVSMVCSDLKVYRDPVRRLSFPWLLFFNPFCGDWSFPVGLSQIDFLSFRFVLITDRWDWNSGWTDMSTAAPGPHPCGRSIASLTAIYFNVVWSNHFMERD
jgi:hypothetical protein